MLRKFDRVSMLGQIVTLIDLFSKSEHCRASDPAPFPGIQLISYKNRPKPPFDPESIITLAAIEIESAPCLICIAMFDRGR